MHHHWVISVGSQQLSQTCLELTSSTEVIWDCSPQAVHPTEVRKLMIYHYKPCNQQLLAEY